MREREAPARTGNSNSGRAGETQTGRTNQISGVEGKFLSRPKGGQEMDTRQVSKPEMAGNFTLTVAGRGHCGPFGLVRGRGGMCFPLETTGSGRMWAERSIGTLPCRDAGGKFGFPGPERAGGGGRKTLETCQMEQRGSHGLGSLYTYIYTLHNNPYSF